MAPRHTRLLGVYLSALQDGDLGGPLASALRRHVAACSDCQEAQRRLTDQIKIMAGLRDPGSEPDSADSAAWRELRRRIPEAPARASLWRPILLWPVLGTVAVVAIVASLSLYRGQLLMPAPSDDVLISMAEEEFRQAEDHYAQAVRRLLQVQRHARAGWTQAQIAAYDAGMVALQDATERCQRAARMRPADAEAQQLLYASYRKQIAFLQESLRNPHLKAP